MREVDGVKSWLHRDHLNSVRFITGATGLTARLTSYTPFGTPTDAITDPAVTDESKGFIGERYQELADALYGGRTEQYVETPVTFEDGRSGVVSATLKISDAKTYPSVRRAA